MRNPKTGPCGIYLGGYYAPGQWYLRVDADGIYSKKLIAQIGTDYGVGMQILSSSKIPECPWYNAVLVWDSDGTQKARLYINGIEKWGPLQTAGNPSGSVMNTTTKLYLGANPNKDGFFRGSIDDVRIYNRALSASEVKQLYEKGIALNGSVKGIDLKNVVCKNLTTGQSIIINGLESASWNCSAAGFIVNKGDSIQEVLNGAAQ